MRVFLVSLTSMGLLRYVFIKGETDEESVAEPHEESLSNAYKRRMTLVSKEEPLPDEANEEEGICDL